MIRTAVQLTRLICTLSQGASKCVRALCLCMRALMSSLEHSLSGLKKSASVVKRSMEACRNAGVCMCVSAKGSGFRKERDGEGRGGVQKTERKRNICASAGNVSNVLDCVCVRARERAPIFEEWYRRRSLLRGSDFLVREMKMVCVCIFVCFGNLA